MRTAVVQLTITIAAMFAVAATAQPSPDTGNGKIAADPMSAAGRLAQQRIAQVAGGLKIEKGGCAITEECDNGGPEPGVPATQSETSIAVDSTGQHIVIGFNDFRGFLTNPAGTPVSISGVMYSDDGGNTFKDGGRLPTGPTRLISGQLFPQIFGDPDVKYLGGCNFVYASLMVTAFNPPGTGLVQTLSVHKSSDCGHTWNGPYEVTPATNPAGSVDVNGDANEAADKELADVDPETGRYMLCFTDFGPTTAQVACTYSDNILSASTPTFQPLRVVTSGNVQGSAVRFAGNGSPNAYVTWFRNVNGYTGTIGFARSTDNGLTWSAPVYTTSAFLIMDYALGNDRPNSFPSLAVDKSSGPFSGNVYLVYSNNNSADGADVALQRSVDSGRTFSAPVLINSAPGRDRPQWFPYVSVDRTTGRVWVFYYDQGVAASGDLTQVSYQYSDDGGVTWSTAAALTPRPFKAGWGNDPNEPNLGDYNQGVAQDGTFYASYAQTRLVGFADGQPQGVMTTPDVGFAKVNASSIVAPLRAAKPIFGDSGGNGNIDPGEQVLLGIPLQNFTTNPGNAAAVTSITATLSTATPNVAIVQPASTYAAITSGGSAVNDTPFVLQTTPAFKPGTPIELSLNVVTSRGAVTLPITLNTGTPVYTTLLSESFDGVAPGALPPGWSVAHGAGSNTVPWRTSNTFAPSLCGTSNKAYHPNANDGASPTGSQSRWERLFSPAFQVPGNADYVTVEFDVCYDTEDDPVLPLTAYDGFFLRVTDGTPGRTLRSVLAEAFEEEFTTDGFEHYPKHFPRSNDPNYFPDMSAWAGFSNGVQHVRLKFPGMAGSVAQLRWEYTQDSNGICSDVRAGHQCGVTLDNVVVRAVTNVAPLTVDLALLQPALTRDATQITASVKITNGGTGPADNVQLTSVTLNGTAASGPLPSIGSIPAGGSVTVTLTFPGTTADPGAPGVLSVAGTYTGGTFRSSARVAIP